MIPKRIIVTHKSRLALNTTHQHCWQKMQALHPGWEILFFSDGDCEQFIRDHQPGYLELYRWIRRPVMKADLFRLLAVQALGGFYLDLDVGLDFPLDDLCPHQAVFPWEHEMSLDWFERRFPGKLAKGLSRWQVGNYAFAAEAWHPFLAAILEEVVRRTAGLQEEFCGDPDILRCTGPDVVSTVYYRQPASRKSVTMLWGVNDKVREKQMFGKYGRHLLTGVWKGGA